jgi:hypothetical protein
MGTATSVPRSKISKDSNSRPFAAGAYYRRVGMTSLNVVVAEGAYTGHSDVITSSNCSTIANFFFPRSVGTNSFHSPC